MVMLYQLSYLGIIVLSTKADAMVGSPTIASGLSYLGDLSHLCILAEFFHLFNFIYKNIVYSL